MTMAPFINTLTENLRKSGTPEKKLFQDSITYCRLMCIKDYYWNKD